MKIANCPFSWIMYRIACNTVSIVLAVFSFILYMKHIEGAGWLLFGSIITHVHVKYKQEYKEESKDDEDDNQRIQ